MNNKEYPISKTDCGNTINLLHSFYVSDEKNDWIDVNKGYNSSKLGQIDDEISKLYRLH